MSKNIHVHIHDGKKVEDADFDPRVKRELGIINQLLTDASRKAESLKSSALVDKEGASVIQTLESKIDSAREFCFRIR